MISFYHLSKKLLFFIEKHIILDRQVIMSHNLDMSFFNSIIDKLPIFSFYVKKKEEENIGYIVFHWPFIWKKFIVCIECWAGVESKVNSNSGDTRGASSISLLKLWLAWVTLPNSPLDTWKYIKKYILKVTKTILIKFLYTMPQSSLPPSPNFQKYIGWQQLLNCWIVTSIHYTMKSVSITIFNYNVYDLTYTYI